MHRAIGYLSKRFVEVRAGEGRKACLTFLYFFLVITAYYVIKPVSRALVLDELGSRLVPYVDLISAIIMGPMVALFARLVDRLEKRWLVNLTLWAVTACLIVFWRCLTWPELWIPAVFAVWVSVFSVLVVTLFWLVANDLYHPREAKRLFGFIGSGGILGGITGSAIAAGCAKLLGTEQLLLVSAVMLLVCWFVVQRLWRYAPAMGDSGRFEKRSKKAAHPKTAGVRQLLFQSRYLLLLVGLVGIAKMLSTFFYYQLNPFIEQRFPDADAKTAFTGLFFGGVNVVAFIVQFFFTSWILRRLGLTCALLLLPIGALGGAVGLAVIPMFWLAAVTELYDASMNYSLQQTTKEVLYLPIDRSIRYKVKPFIDMVVFRFGKGMAAVVGILCLDVWNLEARVLSYLSIPLIVGWIALALQLRRGYVKTIRRLLQARAASRRRSAREVASLPPLRSTVSVDSQGLEAQVEALTHGDPAYQKLAFASQLFGENGALAMGGERLLEALAQYEERPRTAGASPTKLPLEQLKGCLQDPQHSMATRRWAIKQLVRRDGQDVADYLLRVLEAERDATMRCELLRGLTKLRVRHPATLVFPQPMVREQIVREVGAYQRMIQIATIYRYRSDRLITVTDPLLGVLRLLIEETTQQIFRLLALLYPPEDIFLIYNQLREPEAYLRADAIELLDNLIDPGLRRLLAPVLDEDQFLEALERPMEGPVPSDEEINRWLREGVWDANQWLGILTVCLIGRLRLEPLFGELDRASVSSLPVVSLAAQLSRRLAEFTPPFPPAM